MRTRVRPLYHRSVHTLQAWRPQPVVSARPMRREGRSSCQRRLSAGDAGAMAPDLGATIPADHGWHGAPEAPRVRRKHQPRRQHRGASLAARQERRSSSASPGCWAQATRRNAAQLAQRNRMEVALHAQQQHHRRLTHQNGGHQPANLRLPELQQPPDAREGLKCLNWSASRVLPRLLRRARRAGEWWARLDSNQ